MIDWINGDPSIFILLQDFQCIIDRGNKLPFPDEPSSIELLST